MDSLVTDILLNVLMISITFSVILMALIQKIKDLEIINKSYQVWIINLILSFLVGIPFAIVFYDLKLNLAVWVSIFGFIGAPTIYETLKKQNIINYKPKSTSDNKETITISKDNEIKRN
ncbi:MAG: hypothetical protein PUC23_01715 [bacterium]|nr:hypothetical protein [bacterium]